MSNQQPTITDWVTEGHARIRKMNIDQVFLGSLIDQLFTEIVKRDQTIAKLSEAKEAERPTNE